MNDVMIFDTDTHITEPADLWTSRLPAKWGDDRLHVRWDDRLGVEVWVLGDRVLGPAWGPLNYGWDKPYTTEPPPSIGDCHPATYDPNERVKVMEADGVRVAVLYPNIGGADLMKFGWAPEVAAAHVSAYNDYQLEWCSAAPGRYIPMAAIPYWDVERSVAEIERIAGRGFGAVVTTGAPHLHNLPYLGDPHWSPVWSVADAAGLSISFHAGNGDMSQHLNEKRNALDGTAAFPRAATGAFLDNGQQVLDLILCGVLTRFPNLKFVSVESGIGWIPFVLDACDYHFKRSKVWRDRPDFGDMLPSDLFRRQVYANYWFERLEDWHLDALGADHIMFETDFPHPTCLSGDSLADALDNGLQAVSPEVREKILWRNAAELYGLDIEASGASSSAAT